jgi:hypothetical protein
VGCNMAVRILSAASGQSCHPAGSLESSGDLVLRVLVWMILSRCKVQRVDGVYSVLAGTAEYMDGWAREVQASIDDGVTPHMYCICGT